MAKKDTANRPSQPHLQYVTTRDGRKVKNTAYKPSSKSSKGSKDVMKDILFDKTRVEKRIGLGTTRAILNSGEYEPYGSTRIVGTTRDNQLVSVKTEHQMKNVTTAELKGPANEVDYFIGKYQEDRELEELLSNPVDEDSFNTEIQYRSGFVDPSDTRSVMSNAAEVVRNSVKDDTDLSAGEINELWGEAASAIASNADYRKNGRDTIDPEEYRDLALSSNESILE